MNATQNVQVLSSFRQPQKNFRQKRGHRQAVAVKSSIIIFERTSIAVNGVECQQTINIAKTRKTVYMVFRRNISYSSISGDKRHTGRHAVIGSKVGLQ